MKGVGRPPIVRPVDLGLPSGIMWAPCNVDARTANGFADSPFQPSASYVSWGNTVCHELNRDRNFDYDWGTSNEGPYSQTPGSSIVYPGSVPIENDVAHVICGGSWRLPTSTEFTELIEHTVFIDEYGYDIPESQQDKRITMNGVVGVRLRSQTNGAAIFIPCSGRGEGYGVISYGGAVYCWASDLQDAGLGKALVITQGNLFPAYGYARYRGLSIRPVWDPSL